MENTSAACVLAQHAMRMSMHSRFASLYLNSMNFPSRYGKHIRRVCFGATRDADVDADASVRIQWFGCPNTLGPHIDGHD